MFSSNKNWSMFTGNVGNEYTMELVLKEICHMRINMEKEIVNFKMASIVSILVQTSQTSKFEFFTLIRLLWFLRSQTMNKNNIFLIGMYILVVFVALFWFLCSEIGSCWWWMCVSRAHLRQKYCVCIRNRTS